MRSTYFRPVIIAVILVLLYTIWATMTDSTHGILYHLSGGLFIAGFLLIAVGFFSNMSANGFFRGMTAGFKKQREAKLREIDGDYYEDEDEEEEVLRKKQRRASARTKPYVSSGVIFIVVSLIISYF